MAGEDFRVGDHGWAGLGDLHRVQDAGRGGGFAEEDGELGELAIGGVVARRQARGGFLAEAGGGGVIGSAMTGERDLEDALAVLLDADVLGLRDGLGGGDDGGEVFLATATGEGERGVEGEVAIVRRLHLGAPLRDRLMFDGDAGGVAHPAVGVSHERPSLGERVGGRRSVAEGFEFTAQLLFRRRVEPSCRSGGLRALVADAVEGGLAAAAADGHVHEAILRTDHDIRHGERTTRREDFLAGLPAAAFRRQVDRIQRREGPIAGEERALVGRGELGARAHGGARRGTRTDVDEGWLHVERRERVVARAGAPTQLAAGRAEVDARRTVPRGAHVPFHVGIVGEDVAVGSHRAIVGIAEAGRHADPILAVLVHARDPAAHGLDAGGVAIGIFELLQQVILIVALGGRAGLFVVGELGVVAADHEDRTIAVEHELVRAVFARALEGANHGLLRVGAVALDVAEAPDVALALFARAGVERAVGEEQPVAADGLGVDLGDRRLGRILERHMPEHAALVAGDEVTRGRDRERDP